MIIQINEIDKDYFSDYVFMYPVCNGENVTIEDWLKVYGVAPTSRKTNIYELMKDIDNWSNNNFGEACCFEFG